MKEIILLTDYQNRFGTKYDARPYRSGMDKKLLEKYFHQIGYSTEFINIANFDVPNLDLQNKYILYTSSEDKDGLYKSYIEDIVYALDIMKAKIIPEFFALRAHDNKVFMELLLSLHKEIIPTLNSRYYGTLEELSEHLDQIIGKNKVIKSSSGSMGKGVDLAGNKKELIKSAKNFSRNNLKSFHLKDILRQLKHTGYQPESRHRGKFLVQDFIPNLTNDWKVLIFGARYFVLERKVKNKGFKASGSGIKIFPETIPEGLLDFCRRIYETFNVPQISLDVGLSDSGFILFEVQFLYFGTYTLSYSDCYYTNEKSNWIRNPGKSILEEEYARSIDYFIQNTYR